MVRYARGSSTLGKTAGRYGLIGAVPAGLSITRSLLRNPYNPTSMIIRLITLTFACLGTACISGETESPNSRNTSVVSSESETYQTRLVMLGTGTPNADPERSGPAVAVVVDDRAFIFDTGPGVVRRASKASRDLAIPALGPENLKNVIITHLHSDHTLGLPDILLSPWVLDRPAHLRVVGAVSYTHLTLPTNREV